MKTLFKKMLTVGLLAACASGFAVENMKINGDFKVDKNNKAIGWQLNTYKGFKPFGKIEIIKGEDGANSAKIISAGKITAFYTSKFFPAKAGDQVEFEFEMKGKGSANFGLYMYDKRWIGELRQYKKATNDFAKIKKTFTVKDLKNRTVSRIRIFIQANSGCEVTFKNLTTKITKKK